MLKNTRQLLQALKKERDFFQSGGYGRPFRSEWRSTLLLRDSPLCPDFAAAGALNPCAACPLFLLIPKHKREDAIPCHHIVLNAHGETIASLYQKGSQELLDRAYYDWLCALIAGLEKRESA